MYLTGKIIRNPLPAANFILISVLILCTLSTRARDLTFSVYVTVDGVQSWPADSESLQKKVRRLKDLNIEKVILEVFRSGQIATVEQLRTARDFLQGQGFQVRGGIATVPGKNFGVPQQGKLTWFNWQNPKTGQDLETLMQSVSPLFEEFVVDDFLCTGDEGSDSVAARQERSWSQYRMDLLVDAARRFLIRPARTANPKIRMIIKFPQWYDRFHLFGYDVLRQPSQFDEVWIGTETRGQYTQRYGFVQPYEGFISYRWMRSLVGEKLNAGWFDHGDCDALDFLEQAYQTTLGGATEIILFNFNDIEREHPGGSLLKQHTPVLRELAREVSRHPVQGITAYKPADSDAGGDLYLMDYIGMMGIALIPSAHFPDKERTVFLPTQAAKDSRILPQLEAMMDRQPIVLMTSGFLAESVDGRKIARWAGVKLPDRPVRTRAEKVYVGKNLQEIPHLLDLAMDLELDGATPLLIASAAGKKIPFLTRKESKGCGFYVLNSHTFSQSDFDAVGEVLLCPRQLGLLEVPQEWADVLRQVFHQRLGVHMEAPTRITMQPLSDGSLFLNNYNQTPTTLLLSGKEVTSLQAWKTPTDGFQFSPEKGNLRIRMPARSRLWLRKP